MPGPWTGLQALAAASGYAEAFMEPEAAWPKTEPTDFTITDKIWYRPIDSNPLSKDQVMVGFYMGSIYHMHCDRCETKWLAEANSVPKCWYCGKFVRLSHNFKEERRRLREEETNA